MTKPPRLDLWADFNNEDDDGFGWSALHHASDPALVTPGHASSQAASGHGQSPKSSPSTTTAWFTFVCSRATTPTRSVSWRTLPMADDARSFRAVYEHDAVEGAWLVHVDGVDGVDGCHTYGRTKSEAGERIEEALAAWLDKEPNEFTVSHA